MVIYPIGRVWHLCYPIQRVPSDNNEERPEPSMTHLRQLIINQIQTPQFQLSIERIKSKKIKLNDQDKDILQCAYVALKHEVPSADETLSKLSSLIQGSSSSRAFESSSDLILSQCKNRIRGMLQLHRKINIELLNDVADRLYQSDVSSNVIEYVASCLVDAVNEDPKSYGRAAVDFHETQIHNPDPFISDLASRFRVYKL